MRLNPVARMLALVAVAAFLPAASSSAEIQAGLAQVDITPPIGGGTTGYASAQPTDGIHDPVTARVLVLKSEKACVAIAVCDLCIFNSAWVHEQMPALGVDHLLLANTHTHAGPDLREDDFPSAEKPWRRTVEERLVETVKQAKENLFPAFFAAGDGQLQLGYNRLVRRGEYAETHFENPDRIPYGRVDPIVGVIRITDDSRAVRAVLVVYACHPVVLGPRNRKISADYPGVMRDFVEKELGGGATCIFIQGAGGDINPLMMARGEDREGDFPLVERMGQLLGAEVLRVLKHVEDEPGASGELLTSSSLVKLANRWNPAQEMTLGTAALLINGRIGIITVPGEPFSRFQLDFREKSDLSHAYLFGYCSNGPYDWPRYLPDIVSAARGGYGASDTTEAEVGAGERLVNLGLSQLFTLQGRLKPEPERHLFDSPPSD